MTGSSADSRPRPAQILARGQNCALDGLVNTTRAVAQWRDAGPVDVDLIALLTTAEGRVRNDADMVFFNQPNAPGVRHLGKSNTPPGARTDSVEVTLSSVPAAIETIVLAISLEGATAGDVDDLHLTVLDEAGTTLVRFDDLEGLEHERCLILGELYRRAGAWKFRAVGQGYASGLAGLATDFGISVNEPPPSSTSTETSTAGAATAAAPQDAEASRVDWMNPPVPAGYEI